jgi:hypothetical protein
MALATWTRRGIGKTNDPFWYRLFLMDLLSQYRSQPRAIGMPRSGLKTR